MPTGTYRAKQLFHSRRHTSLRKKLLFALAARSPL